MHVTIGVNIMKNKKIILLISALAAMTFSAYANMEWVPHDEFDEDSENYQLVIGTIEANNVRRGICRGEDEQGLIRIGKMGFHGDILKDYEKICLFASNEINDESDRKWPSRRATYRIGILTEFEILVASDPSSYLWVTNNLIDEKTNLFNASPDSNEIILICRAEKIGL